MGFECVEVCWDLLVRCHNIVNWLQWPSLLETSEFACAVAVERGTRWRIRRIVIRTWVCVPPDSGYAGGLTSFVERRWELVRAIESARRWTDWTDQRTSQIGGYSIIRCLITWLVQELSPRYLTETNYEHFKIFGVFSTNLQKRYSRIWFGYNSIPLNPRVSVKFCWNRICMCWNQRQPTTNNYLY